MIDDTDDSIPQVFQFGTPGIKSFVALLLRDHECEGIKHAADGKMFVRCRCTPQVFRTDQEWREHVAAIIVQKLDDLYHREIDNAFEN